MSQCPPVSAIAREDVSSERRATVEDLREEVKEAVLKTLRPWVESLKQDLLKVPKCGAALICDRDIFTAWPTACTPELFQELTVELPKCGPEFYERCDFDRLIRICPFDPAWDAFEWRLAKKERLDALELRVERLEA